MVNTRVGSAHRLPSGVYISATSAGFSPRMRLMLGPYASIRSFSRAKTLPFISVETETPGSIMTSGRLELLAMRVDMTV